MKKCIATTAIISLLVAGCAATTEEKQAYSNSVDLQTRAIIATVEKQGEANRTQESQMMQFFANASSNAARTASDADDVLVAFAWGYRMGTPTKIEIPTLPTIRPPTTDVDRIRAWTPIMAMAVPFLYPLAYVWANNSDKNEQNYVATDNGRINVASQNPGSNNVAGHDVTTFTDPDNTSLGMGGDGLQTNAEKNRAPVECGGATAAVFGDGVWWANKVNGCSCDSRVLGDC